MRRRMGFGLGLGDPDRGAHRAAASPASLWTFRPRSFSTPSGFTVTPELTSPQTPCTRWQCTSLGRGRQGSGRGRHVCELTPTERGPREGGACALGSLWLTTLSESRRAESLRLGLGGAARPRRTRGSRPRGRGGPAGGFAGGAEAPEVRWVQVGRRVAGEPSPLRGPLRARTGWWVAVAPWALRPGGADGGHGMRAGKAGGPYPKLGGELFSEVGTFESE